MGNSTKQKWIGEEYSTIYINHSFIFNINLQGCQNPFCYTNHSTLYGMFFTYLLLFYAVPGHMIHHKVTSFNFNLTSILFHDLCVFP